MTRRLRPLAALAAACLWSTPAAAERIDFEDRAPANDAGQTLSEEYAHLGLHFVTSDAATWAGRSDGDPGGWQVDGSEGPTFAGFDGASYQFVASFDAPVSGFQLDVARAAGGIPFLFFEDFTLVGLRNGGVVAQQRVFLLSVDQWQTLLLDAEVDQVLGFGRGLPGLRFAIDNLRWQGPEELVWPVEIDIRPGSDTNPVQLSSRGVVPVLILGSDELDVGSLDPHSLVFGPDAAALAHRNGPHLLDHDGDGRQDLLLHFRVEESGLLPEDEEACVGGETWDGDPVEGCDLVTPVPGR